MKQTVHSTTKSLFHFFIQSKTIGAYVVQTLCLSWLYALCSQIILPLPFNLVPISLQPAPLFLAAFVFGWQAVSAYVLYMIQGACGLPFFSGFGGGLVHLLGPTGGYLVGFGMAMALIAATRHMAPNVSLLTMIKLVIAHALVFACGLFQLAWFVPVPKLLAVGLYPFLIGDVIKIVAVWLVVKKRKKHCKNNMPW